MDSTAYLEVLNTHCQHIKLIMERASESAIEDRIETVFQHSGKIAMLIAEERRVAQRLCDENADENQIYGPLLTRFLTEGILERLQSWIDRQISVFNDADFSSRIKTEFLHIIENLLDESCTSVMRAHLIADARFIIPVSSALKDIDTSRLDVPTQKQLISTCCQLSVAFRSNIPILRCAADAVFQLDTSSPSQRSNGDFRSASARTLLQIVRSFVTHMNHDSIELAQPSRDALLALLALSSMKSNANESVPRITDVLLEHTHFCALLAASLSGFFSALPRDLLATSSSHSQVSAIDDPVGRCWTRLDEVETNSCIPLRAFVSAYTFCDAACAAASGAARRLLATLVRASFFEPVLAPALFDGAHDEVVSSTCLLELCARRTHSRALSHALVTFVLTAQSDGYSVVHALANRLVGASAALTVATVQLFDALFQLRFNEPLVRTLVVEPLLLAQGTDPLCASQSSEDGQSAAAANAKSDSDLSINDPLAFVEMARQLLRHGIPECFRIASVDPSLRDFAQRCETDFAEYLRDARDAICASRDRLMRWRTRPGVVISNDDLLSDSESDEDNAWTASPSVVNADMLRKTECSLASSSNVTQCSAQWDAHAHTQSTSDQTVALPESVEMLPNQIQTQTSAQVQGQPMSTSDANTSNSVSRFVGKATPARPHTSSSSNVSRSSSYYTLNFVELELEDDPVESSSTSASSTRPDLIGAKPDLIAERNPAQPDLVGLGGANVLVDDSGFDELLGGTEMSVVNIDIDSPPGTMNELIAELRGVLGEVVPTFGVPTERELHDEAQAQRDLELPNYIDEQARFDEAFLSRLEAEFAKRRANHSATERRLASRMRKNAQLPPICVMSHSNADSNPKAVSNVGPFLNALFWRLESFTDNHLAVNLALTGLLFQIASIPHCLIRSFMLTSFASISARRWHSKSLFELLTAAKGKADRLALPHEPAELFRCVVDAYQTLLGRMHYRGQRLDEAPLNSSFDAGVHALAKNNERKARKVSPGGTLFDLFRNRQPSQRRLSVVSETSQPEPHNKLLFAASNQRFRNYVFGLIILKEFLKELAALCVEHAAAQVSEMRPNSHCAVLQEARN